MSIALSLGLFAATESVTDSTATPINDRRCFDKNLNITLDSIITNIQIEVNLDHTWRADLDIYLTSPEGTKIALTTDNGGGNDNLYVVFKDDATQSITSDSTTHTSVVERKPEDALNTFNDENSQGTWILQVCDDYAGDTGIYNYATLTIEGKPIGGDLQISNIGSASPDPVRVDEDVTFELETRNRTRTTHHDITVEISYNQDVTITEAFQFYTTNTSYGFTCDQTSGLLSAGDKITCTKPNNWTSTSNHKDLRITVQPSTAGTLTQTAVITSLTDADPDTTNNSIQASVTVNPKCNGCDCSLDTSANDTSPGVVIPALDGATTDVTTCISGSSEDDDNDYYNFTIGAAGTLHISTSSPNNHDYHMEITSNTQGTLLSYDTDQNRNLTYILADNEQIIIRIKETGSDLDEYQVNFEFTEGVALVAIDNNYTTTAGANISGNFITDDTGNGVDSGVNIVADTTPVSGPTQGTVTINSDGSFIYAPDSNATGSDSFTYRITDDSNATDTATVTISIEIEYTDGVFLPFTLINPPHTRNIIGNYGIAGNTVLCLTEKTDGYGGTCHGDDDAYLNITSNMHVSKYLDIDNNGGTWNSTSSYINIPNTYDPSQNIVWAGLFWQGRVAWDNTYSIHYPQPNGNSSFTTVEVGKNSAGGPVDVAGVGAINIKLQVDDGNYSDVQAMKFHTYSSSNGQTYAAFSDVTHIVKSANLGIGKHTFTVANLLTMEGREGSPGAYGGWSIVVIYGENFLTSKPRNISIYNGFISIGSNDDPIEISGFKLPKGGDVRAQLSVFSGEGEYLYGRTSTNNSKDNMKISDQANTGYQNLPGCTAGTDLGNCNNIFDAHLAGILRDNIPGEFNDQSVNNVGIDVDTYDVSSIMTDYRDDNPDINTTYIQTYSNNDYITPSMIAFSAELYKPSVCYDYTIQKDGFDITGDERAIQTVGQGDLSINIALQSEEGDFDFESSNLGIELIPTADTTFVDALYAPNNVNTMIPAIYSTDHTSLHPKIAIGEKVSASGGTIKRLQRYFAEFNYHIDADHYDGKFELELNSTVNYGSGAVPIIQSTVNGSITRCPQSNYYNPIHGSFNVERTDSDAFSTVSEPEKRYTLYTQVVGKDFDFDVVAYQELPLPLYSTDLTLNGYTVDVELINARPFNDANSTFVCNNPNPKIIQTLNNAGDKHVFATFNNSSRVDMSTLDIQTDTALRNAAFRIWYIVDKNNTIIPYVSDDPSDNAYFQNIYDQHLKADDTTLQASGTRGFCTVETIGGNGCSDYINPKLGTSGCYACIRDFFSRAVCSRDNFSIRPAAYRISITDTNESTTPTTTVLLGSNNNSTEDPVAKILAGYYYKLDGNATSYLGDQTIAKGYTRTFDGNSSEDLSSILVFNDDLACYDRNNTKWGISFINSVITGIVQNNDINLSAGNLVKHSNVGKYRYIIHDSNWTIIDQQRYQYKTFAGVDDCDVNSSSIATDSISKSGCDINSKLTSNTGVNNPIYNDLYLLYEPYKFDLSDISFHTKPANQKYLFMTDFDDPYYTNAISLSNPMAASYEGNITSFSKDGKITTNFTDSCAASKLTIRLSRETNASESILKDQYDVKMQQYLQYGSDVDLQTTFDDMQLGQDSNLTLSKAAFEDNIAPGSARIRIYTTFKKPDKNQILDGSEGINPIRVRYQDINATGYEANSSAELGMYIPKGVQSVDHNVTFLYAKVTPDEKLYTTEDASVSTPLNVIVYCDYGPAICRNLDLNTSINISHESSYWYLASNLFTSKSDFGTMDLNVSYFTGKAPGNANLTKYRGLGFEVNATTETPFDVGLPADNPRPVTVKIIYLIPDYGPPLPPPWLSYDLPSQFYYVRFIPKPTAWTGHGKTGHVVGDDISTTKTQRLEW